MSYVWELDVEDITWHLKKVWDKDKLGHKFAHPLRGQWKVSMAWVRKIGDCKWQVHFATNDPNDNTFRSLKAAKAYALAIITLE
jgi:hypothetical protein